MKNRITLLRFLLVSIVALTLGLQVDQAQASSLNATDRPPDSFAKLSLSAMYVPFEDFEYWTSLVCSGMTQGGCDYFLENNAQTAWQTQKEMGVIGDSLEFQESIAPLGYGLELWHMKLNVYTPDETQVYDVYATVANVDSQWLLDRIVVGPGISPE